jgi:hypothetical protein
MKERAMERAQSFAAERRCQLAQVIHDEVQSDSAKTPKFCLKSKLDGQIILMRFDDRSTAFPLPHMIVLGVR